MHDYLLPTEIGATRPITLLGDADHADWVRSAYEALLGSREGDCFGYASVAKAFCMRMGVEYHVIQRTEGVTVDTHFWLLVNVGTESEPLWYHFDCTPLQIPAANRGCLMTDAQLRDYNQKRKNFYAFDASSYPVSTTEVFVPATP